MAERVKVLFAEASYAEFNPRTMGRWEARTSSIKLPFDLHIHIITCASYLIIHKLKERKEGRKVRRMEERKKERFGDIT